MTYFLDLLFALLIGVVAGLRALTAPAVVSWAAALGWLTVDDTWAHWVAHPITVTVLTILAVVELVTDQLPKTPSRKTAAVRGTAGHRRLRGCRSRIGAVLITRASSAHRGGVIGAVLGTLGGYEARKRLVAATGGRDLPVALLEDAVAVVGGFAVVALAAVICGRSTDFDAIIVGAGQAGPPLAGRLTAAGQTVAVIERKQSAAPASTPGASRPRRWSPARTRRTSPAAVPITASAAARSPSTWQRSRRARTGSCSTTVTASSRGWRAWTGCTLIRGHAAFRRPTHLPRRRRADLRPTGSSSTSAGARWCPTFPGLTTSTT